MEPSIALEPLYVAHSHLFPFKAVLGNMVGLQKGGDEAQPLSGEA